MNIINITDDNDICNCTENDNMIIEISPLIIIILSIIPYFLSIICCVSFMICSFIKLIKKYHMDTYKYNNIYT